MSQKHKPLRAPVNIKRVTGKGYAEQRTNAVNRSVAVRRDGPSTVESGSTHIPQSALAEREAAAVEPKGPSQAPAGDDAYVDVDVSMDPVPGESTVGEGEQAREGSEATTHYTKKVCISMRFEERGRANEIRGRITRYCSGWLYGWSICGRCCVWMDALETSSLGLSKAARILSAGAWRKSIIAACQVVYVVPGYAKHAWWRRMKRDRWI